MALMVWLSRAVCTSSNSNMYEHATTVIKNKASEANMTMLKTETSMDIDDIYDVCREAR